MILLTSQDFVKSISNLDDNLQAGYLAPAIREAQETELQQVLGSKLMKKLQDLVAAEEIDEDENIHYKELLDKCQYFIAYTAIVQVIPKCSFKISNMGANQAEDDKIKSLPMNDVLKLQELYQHKADAYKKALQGYIMDNIDNFPELNENSRNEMQSNLYSAASSGIFLGGARGKKGRKSVDICYSGGKSGGGGGEGTTDYNELKNKPQINNTELNGNKTLSELGIQEELQAGENIVISGNTISATDTTYEAGENITISGNTISATDTTYTAGSGITIDNNVISADGLVTEQELDELEMSIAGALNRKQDTLVAGANITISGNTISATDTTYVAGTGITIDNNVISATGGGESNYVIVDSLDEITEPYEGLVAYKRETQELLTWSGFTFDASAITEGYAIHIDRNDRNIAEIYRAGINFFWSWTTDGEIHKFSSGDVTCFYQASTDGTFKIAFEDLSDITYRLETGVEYVGETTLSFTEVYKQEEYIHTGTEWLNISQYIDFSTNDWNGTKCANFRNWLFSMSEPIRNTIKWSGKAPNDLYEGPLELSVVNERYNMVVFRADKFEHNGVAGINAITALLILISDHMELEYNNQFPDIELTIDNNHNLSLSGTKNDRYAWFNIERTFWANNDYAHLILMYNNLFLPAYKANIDNTNCIVLDEVREGTRYKGKWKTSDGTVISWSEEPVEKNNYVIVDDLSGITTPYEGLVAWVNGQSGNLGKEYIYYTTWGWIQKNMVLNLNTAIPEQVKSYLKNAPADVIVKNGLALNADGRARIVTGCNPDEGGYYSYVDGRYYYGFDFNGSNGGIRKTEAFRLAKNDDIKTYTAGTGINITNNTISTSGVVQSSTLTNMVKLTQAEYNALATKDANTFYVIVG